MKSLYAAAVIAAIGAFATTSADARLYIDANGNWTRTAPKYAKAPKIPREEVEWSGNEKPGTIIVDTGERRLYLIQNDGTAMKYGVGVGRQGFEWSGTHRITRKAEWPGWTPPASMRRREAAKGRILPAHMPGGIKNPLGARALYIGSTLYRIHGTNNPNSIGQAMSSGCIRMINDDVVDLAERVKVGAKVVVRH